MAERIFSTKWKPLGIVIVALCMGPMLEASAQNTGTPSTDASADVEPSSAGASDLSTPETTRAPVDVQAPDANTESADADADVQTAPAEPASNDSAPDTVAAEDVASANTASEGEASGNTAPEGVADSASSAPKTDTRAQVNVAHNGLRVKSADGRFAFGLMPFLQMGYRQVASDLGDSASSGFVLTHFRPIITGKYAEFLSYNFILNVSTSKVNILNAFVTFHAHKRLNIRVGLQKPVFGIELRQAQPTVLFINRSMASSIGSARDMGIALDARPVDSLRLEAGVYNGTDDQKVFSGIQERSVGGDASVRWYAVGNDRPATKDDGFLTLGASGLLRRNEGSAATTHLTARKSAAGHTYANYEANTFADGRKFASNVFAHGGYKGLYFQAEFTTSNQQVNNGADSGRIVERAWQAAATYTIGGVTGWTGTRPDKTLFDGGLGALQIKARGHGLTARARGGDFLELGDGPSDSLSAIGASAGLSWFLSEGVRVIADYNWTTFGRNAKRLDNANEHSLYLGIAAGY